MTWASRASRASRRPISTAALPPTPGVDLVEDERRHRVRAGEDDLDRQHDRDSSPPEAPFCSGSGGRARMGGEPDLHVVGAVRAGLVQRDDRHRQPGMRHRQRGKLAR